MNFLEVSKIIDKMIDNTMFVMIDLKVSTLKKGIIIDKNIH